MRCHIGVDSASDLVHSVVSTAANVHELIIAAGSDCMAKRKWSAEIRAISASISVRRSKTVHVNSGST